MKKLYLSILFALSLTAVSLHAQDTFQYQALIRNDDGSSLSESSVKVRFKIRQSTADGNIIFAETHQSSTNIAGIVNLLVGKGVAEHGSLSDINWGNGLYFIETEVDKGNGYVSTGTQQLFSVPYAKYASNAKEVRIKSENGKVWNIIIDNDGNISTQEVTQ